MRELYQKHLRCADTNVLVINCAFISFLVQFSEACRKEHLEGDSMLKWSRARLGKIFQRFVNKEPNETFVETNETIREYSEVCRSGDLYQNDWLGYEGYEEYLELGGVAKIVRKRRRVFRGSRKQSPLEPNLVKEANIQRDINFLVWCENILDTQEILKRLRGKGYSPAEIGELVNEVLEQRLRFSRARMMTKVQ